MINPHETIGTGNQTNESLMKSSVIF